MLEPLGSIHRIDARVKILFTLAMIIFVNLTPSKAWPAYVLFFALNLSLALLSHIGMGVFFRKALLATPFILAAAPLIFVGPSPHASVMILKAFYVTYSPEGVARFISISIKVWLSLQAAILLTTTTRPQDLLTALQQLRVPKIFVVIIGLMWRYLFLISDEVKRLLHARESRSGFMPDKSHAGGTVFWRARVTGGIAGNLFLRSIERSERVYAAMLSRGYTGELPDREVPLLSRKVLWFLVLGIVLLSLLWLLGFLTGG